MFALHPQLEADCVPVADMAVCRVLLMNNARFPWLVLVPMRVGVRELHELAEQDFEAVTREMRVVAKGFGKYCQADKMNVAALGNIVPQLHIHIVARFVSDAAWPQPVWNSGVSAQAYEAGKLAVLVSELQTLIA